MASVFEKPVRGAPEADIYISLFMLISPMWEREIICNTCANCVCKQPPPTVFMCVIFYSDENVVAASA